MEARIARRRLVRAYMQRTPILVRTEALRIERRRFPDRRQRETRMLSRWTFFGGRREAGRREGENANVFVDRYGQGTFLLATAIVLLNALDAFFTLLFLGLGGEELNPVALRLLEMGPMVFLGVKTLGIGLCTMYLVIVSKYRGVIWGFLSVVAIYSALLAWHLYLYSHI
ncbi:MAG TPA: DUF5658 family protein [Planctomycetota bacterium]|nr:DUF5658 family protein [Planctomycetota bacterium]